MTDAKKPVKRRDATGHLDPAYERDLLEKARETRNEDGLEASARAFIPRARTGEELAESRGEAFIQAATSGEDQDAERLDDITTAETGGPFVVTQASEEFAEGTDESNTEDATREPFPRTSNNQP